MDDERNKDNGAENDFEAQLAELIKQSGGVVPPKKNPEPAPPKENTGDAENPESTGGKSPDEIEAEIEAIIDNMAGRERTESANAEAGDFGFAMPGAFDFAEPTELEKNSDSLDDILAEIDRLEQEAEEDTPSTEQTAESAKLDDELEAMLASMDEEKPEPEPEPVFVYREPEPQPEPEPEPEPVYVRDEPTPEPKAEVVENAEVVPPPEEPKKSEPIDVGKFDKVEAPKEEKPSPDIAAMEAMLAEFLNEDRKNKEEKENAVVSEMEQMRAKIASLEYMLAQKNSEEQLRGQRERRQARESESAKKADPAPHTGAQTTGGIPTGDINSMFKQWFDLEMAAKMKNIITEDEKKAKEAQTPKTDYDKSPAVVTNEYDSSSDFIKLSDNVYYNVREKKTYVMRELKPTVSRPKKPVKRKVVVKHVARKRRPMHARPGARHAPPRRPAPPRRRP